MDELIQFTPEELSLIADEKFFRAKARLMKKVRNTLDGLYAALKDRPVCPDSQ